MHVLRFGAKSSTRALGEREWLAPLLTKTIIFKSSSSCATPFPVHRSQKCVRIAQLNECDAAFDSDFLLGFIR